MVRLGIFHAENLLVTFAMTVNVNCGQHSPRAEGFVPTAPKMERRRRTVQRDDGNDEANRQDHDDEGVDLEPGRFIRV